jgi:hypothetical protein
MLLAILAAILLIYGVVALLKGAVLFGVILVVVGLLVGGGRLSRQ